MMKKKILIVEDEIIVAQDIKKQVENLGYETAKIAGSGDEAAFEAGKGDIDLILMDILIKGKIDGIQAALEIKKNYDIPVIFLTGHYDDNTLERAKLAEPAGYIVKPAQPRDLQIMIEIALYKHQADMLVKYEREWLYTVIDSINEYLIAVDINDKIKFINKPAASLCGYKQEELAGRNLGDVLIMKNGTSMEEAELIKKNGEKEKASYIIRDTLDKKGERFRIIIII
jgi:PAS domain S-box-containing protein